jgi:hypothetical protein
MKNKIMTKEKLFKIGLSHSRRKELKGCKRKFWYLINNWYNPNSRVKTNTYFGNVCHYLLEQGYTESPGIDKLYNLSVQYDKKNPKKIDNIDENDLQLNKALAVTCINAYFQAKHLNHHKQFFKILGSEVYLKQLNINDYTHNIKIDKVLKQTKSGEIWLLDHKCKGKYNEQNLSKMLRINKQLMLYAKGFEIAYKKPVAGIIQEIIRKPQLRMTQKDDSLKAFIERVGQAIKKEPEKYFHFICVPLSQSMKDDFDFELTQEMKEIYTLLEKSGKYFIKNDELCESPYTCDFLDACSNGGNMNMYLKYF